MAEPEAAAQVWYQKRGVVPVNHLVCVTQSMARSEPDAVAALYAALLQGKTAAGLPRAGAIDFIPFGVNALRRPLELVIRYATQQGLIPRALSVDELFDHTTRGFA